MNGVWVGDMIDRLSVIRYQLMLMSSFQLINNIYLLHKINGVVPLATWYPSEKNETEIKLLLNSIHYNGDWWLVSNKWCKRKWGSSNGFSCWQFSIYMNWNQSMTIVLKHDTTLSLVPMPAPCTYVPMCQ